MGKAIPFFPRQVILGNSGQGGADYYSEIYEIVSESVIDVQTIVFAINGSTTVTVTVEHTTDPTLSTWSTVGSS